MTAINIELTPFAVTTRYPGVDDRVTRKDALNALESAKKVRKIIRRILREEGFYTKGQARKNDFKNENIRGIM